MTCGCKKGRAAGTVAQSQSAAVGVGLGVERGGQQSRVAFFVVVDGVEQEFGTLRQARVAADAAGVGVEARRVRVGVVPFFEV